MKLSIKVKNKTISIEIDESLTILDLKKKTVLEMDDPKPDPESLYFIYGGKKLDDKAIISSILKDGLTVHATVMKKQDLSKKIEIGGTTGNGNVGASPYEASNPYGASNPYIPGANPYGAGANPYGAGVNPYGVGANPYGAGVNPYGTSPNPYGTGNPFGFGVGSPTEMGSEEMVSKIDLMLKNPALLDVSLDQLPGIRTPEQKEDMKKMMIAYLKSIRENPELFKMAMNPEFLKSAGISVPPGVPPMGAPYMNPNLSNPQIHPAMSNPQFNPMVPPQYMYPPPPNYNPYYYQPVAHPPNINYEEAFKEQLKILEEMGYKNKSLNIEALKKANGDVSGAVEFLLEWNK